MPRSGWLASGAVAAALVGGTGGPAAAVAMVGTAVGLAIATTWLRPRGRRAALAFVVGLAAIGLRLIAGPTAPPLDGAPDGRGPWTMSVETVGSPRDGKQVATLRTVAAGTAGFRLAATLPRYPTVEPGDVIEVSGRVRPRPDSAYGAYLERLGAWGSLAADAVRPMSADAGGPARALEGLRRRAGDALTVTLPEPEAGLAAGILIGLRDRVDRDVAAAFTTAGVSHIVAISGWNIAIVAAAITAVAGRLHRRRRAIITVLAITAYVAFAGASASVLRAGAMAGVVLLARETGRAGDAAAALGWAVVVLLLADPALVGDAGFQLSTTATAGLMAWGTPTTAWLTSVSRGRLPGWVSESLGVSLAAQLATLPIVLASFGRLAVIAPVVNLVVVPLVAPAMAAGLVAMLAGAMVGLGAPTAVGAILGAPAWVALRVIISLVEATAALPFASLTLEPPWGGVAAAVMAAGIGLAMVARRRDIARWLPSTGGRAPATSPGTARPGRPTRRGGSTRVLRAATLALVTSVVVTGGVIAVRPAGGVRITVLDVGQGDAILVEGADGGRLLIDGGPDPDRLLVVLDRHIPPWDRRIDAVVLSHPHEDHVAGLALLLDRYRVARVFEPGMRGPGPGYAAWLDRLGRPGAPVRLGLATGDRLAVDAIRFRVLWPDRGSVPAEPPDTGTGINNVSIVLLGEVGGRRFLLTGDIEQDIDPVVLARGVPRVDLLKVAHHGSRTATTEAFVEAAHPTVAVASAGADNPYGHPARSTLERLRASGARVYRTDQDGSVTVSFTSQGMMVRTQPRPVAERVRGSRPALAAVTVGPVRTFLCAVPLGSVSRSDGGGTAGTTLAGTGQLTATAARAAAAPTAASRASDRLDLRLRYHRSDDGSLAGGGGCPAALPGSPTVGARARTRRGRGRGLAGAADRRPRDRRGPGRGGSGGPAARRGQAAPWRRSGARPPPWHGIGGVADQPGSRGARPAGRRSPRHAAGRRGGASPLGCLREP
jgi:competence protein ComEC